ncbi:MAG: MarR family transcriptional regulator [Xanthomonadales bacterium]|nr:MarR family transcriptional regulator [Gammaproteobacteria bacterium]NND55625.1 MarR family transcriptional regulator [Xanthomonadales bacterium]
MNKPKRKPGKAPQPSVFELELFLPYRLSLLTNTVSQGIARGYRQQYDISVTEWRILAVLGRFPGLAAKEIAQRTAMDKVAVSRAVKTLVEKNLLQRITDPTDRRRLALHITPDKGKQLLEEVVPLARAYEQKLLSALNPVERTALSSAIKKLQQKATSLKA